MRGLGLSTGAAMLVLLFGCARFELTGSGGSAGGEQTVGGGPPSTGGGAVGGSTDGGGPPCDMAAVSSDPLNCGSCGHDCYGGDCSDGVCQFEELWSAPPDTNRFAQGITIAGDRVAWVSSAGTLSLERTAPAGTMAVTHSTNAGTRIAFRAPLLYRTWGTLITTPLSADVSDDVELNEEDGVWGSGQCSYDLAIDDDGETYCVNSVNDVGTVYRYTATFMGAPIAVDLAGAFGIAVDDQSFYVGTAGGIWRQDKPPGVDGELVVVGQVTGQLTPVGDSIYFGTTQGLNRYDKASESAQKLLDGVVPNSIHVDAQFVWFTNQEDDQVWRVDLDGQNPRTWGVGSGKPDVIAGDDTFVFITTDDDGRVARLAK